MLSYSLDSHETKRIKVQPHSKKMTVSFLIISQKVGGPEINVLSVAVFLAGSWHLIGNPACVSFSVC